MTRPPNESVRAGIEAFRADRFTTTVKLLSPLCSPLSPDGDHSGGHAAHAAGCATLGAASLIAGQLRQAAFILDLFLPGRPFQADSHAAIALAWRALLAVEQIRPVADIAAAFADAGDAVPNGPEHPFILALARSRLALLRGEAAEAERLASDLLGVTDGEPGIVRTLRLEAVFRAQAARLDLDGASRTLTGWAEGGAGPADKTRHRICQAILARLQGDSLSAVAHARLALIDTQHGEDPAAAAAAAIALAGARLDRPAARRSRADTARVLAWRHAQPPARRLEVLLSRADLAISAARLAAGLPMIDPVSGLILAPRSRRRDHIAARQSAVRAHVALETAFQAARVVAERLQSNRPLDPVTARLCLLREVDPAPNQAGLSLRPGDDALPVTTSGERHWQTIENPPRCPADLSRRH